MDEKFIATVGIIVVIFFLIAELFGRSKHIGRGWTFVLLFMGFIPGIMALASSPSAKRAPTKGSKSHKFWGYILIILGVLNLFVGSQSPEGIANPVFKIIPVFIVLGIYLINLSKGEIINENPKFYFSSGSNPYKPKAFGSPQPQKNEESNGDFSFSKNLENLKSLRAKGLLSENEYNSKVLALKYREVHEEVMNSDDYRQLKHLFDQGIFTETEFNTKFQIMRNNLSNKKDGHGSFSNGLIIFTDHNLNYGFKDRTGTIVIKPIFEYAENFSDGLALIRINRKFGFMDKYGNPIIKNIYHNAESFKNGKALVKLKKRELYIDKKGNEIRSR